MLGVGLNIFTLAIRNAWGASSQFAGTSLNLDFTTGSALDPRVTFTRASSATRINASGVLETVTTNTPRFDYDPVTLAPKGLLIEEQRTNLLTYSEQFDNAAWVIGTGTVTPNSVASPDGTVNADTYTTTGTSAQSIYQTATVTASTVYTFSVYVKLGTLSASNYTIAIYNTTGAAFIAADAVPTQTPTSTGWTRITYSFTTPVGCVSVRVYPFRYATSIASSTVHFYGAQLEAGSFPTSYIPTTSAAATRAADVAVMTGTNFSSWYNQTEGTVYWEGSSLSPLTPSESVAANKYPGAWLISGGAGQSSVNWYGAGADMSIGGTYANQGLFQAFVVHKHALGVAPVGGQSASSLDGGSAVSKNGNTFGTGHTRFEVGRNLNGHIRRIAFFPRRLANSELQAITT